MRGSGEMWKTAVHKCFKYVASLHVWCGIASMCQERSYQTCADQGGGHLQMKFRGQILWQTLGKSSSVVISRKHLLLSFWDFPSPGLGHSYNGYGGIRVLILSRLSFFLLSPFFSFKALIRMFTAGVESSNTKRPSIIPWGKGSSIHS